MILTTTPGAWARVLGVLSATVGAGVLWGVGGILFTLGLLLWLDATVSDIVRVFDR